MLRCGFRTLRLVVPALAFSPYTLLAQQQPAAPAAPAAQPAQNPPAPAADQKPEKLSKGEQELGQVAAGVIQRMQEFSKQNVGLSALATDAISIINYIVAATRADQASVYTFARTVNAHMDKVPCSDQTCRDFVAEIRRINDQMLVESYSDTLFQNGNLSNQIRVRMPLLIEDSLKLTSNDLKEPEATRRRNDFRRELDLLSTRFLNSQRFRAGFGAALAYLPKVVYRDRSTLDFSPYQTTAAVLNGGDTSQYIFEFSDKSVQSLILSANMRYVQIDALFPTFEATEVSVSRVQAFDIDSSATELLARNTVTSELKTEFEISLKFSIPEVMDGIRRKLRDRRERNGVATASSPTAPDERKRRLDRYDWGVGIGTAGFEINNTILSDIRFRTDGTTPFNDLAPGQTLETTDSTSFNTGFVDFYWTLHVTDEVDFGIDFRSYRKETSSNASVNVDDVQFSLTALWYPTWAW